MEKDTYYGVLGIHYILKCDKGQQTFGKYHQTSFLSPLRMVVSAFGVMTRADRLTHVS